MKKLKLFLSSMAVSAMLINPFSAQALDYCNAFTYVVADDSAVITGFKGNPEVLNLPSKIGNKTVTEIRENAFYKCDSLKKVIVPESIEKIGRHAFFECEALETVEIHSDIEEIPEGVFYGCENLSEVIITQNPSVIEEYAFYGCENLKNFTIPQSVVEIGKYSFAYCEKISEIRFGSKLKIIDEGAFFECKSIKKFNLPKNLNSIGNYAIGFSEKGNENSVTITGFSDSIAEYYAKTNNVSYKDRIYYDNSFTLSQKFLKILPWLSLVIIYVVSMLMLFSGFKEKISQK